MKHFLVRAEGAIKKIIKQSLNFNGYPNYLLQTCARKIINWPGKRGHIHDSIPCTAI